MNAFDTARTVEARSLTILMPWLEEQSAGRFVLTNKGRLACLFQETVGDVIFNSATDKRVWSLELKAEVKWTGNLFLELWSNRNLDDPANHARHGSNPGWLVKLTADLLLYHFLDADIVYLISLFRLKRWAFGCAGVDGRLHLFEERVQRKYHQKNDTCGRLVPVDVLMKELPPRSIRVFKPQQGQFEFVQEAA